MLTFQGLKTFNGHLRASGYPRLERGAQLTSLPALRHQQLTTPTIKKDILQGTSPYPTYGKGKASSNIPWVRICDPSQKGSN